MLASHNSFSYAKPYKWWMYLFIPWARCQNKTIEQQYNSGVRYFDIRVRFNNKGNPNYVHNFIRFKGNPINELLKLPNKENIYVRIILDVRKEPKSLEESINLRTVFINYLHTIQKVFWEAQDTFNDKIYIDKAIVYWQWNMPLIDLEYNIIELHSSVKKNWYPFFPKFKLYPYILGTKLFSKLFKKEIEHNKTNIQNQDVYMIDYV